MKRLKREKHKKNLSKLISNHIKENMPNYDEGTMYTMEVFKFMNKKLDIYMNKLNMQTKTFTVIQESLRILHTASKGNIDTRLETLIEHPDRELMDKETALYDPDNKR